MNNIIFNAPILFKNYTFYGAQAGFPLQLRNTLTTKH
jgi:hypothetical protein